MTLFPLARMEGLIFWLTVLVLPLPAVMLWIGAQTGTGAIVWTPAVLVGAIYAFVWFYMRPSRFEIGGGSLDIVWPLRRLSVPRSEITSVELLSGREFRSRYGYGMRIGAGGLWGGFGLLKMRSVTFRFYISKMDDYVIVVRRGGRPLLLTPAAPQQFVRALAPPGTARGTGGVTPS